jgi:predicted nucleic acid-binding protein
VTVYIDSSVFLAIFNGEGTGPEIQELLRELKREKIKIITSIITVQEVSVASYRTAEIATDNHARVHKFAQIQAVTRDVALTAAKIEACVLDRSKSSTAEEKREDNKRRKWDCFHIATAQCEHCDKLYSLDPGMLNRQKLLGITKMQFMEPKASMPPLFALSESEIETPEKTETPAPPEPARSAVRTSGDGPSQGVTGTNGAATEKPTTETKPDPTVEQAKAKVVVPPNKVRKT